MATLISTGASHARRADPALAVPTPADALRACRRPLARLFHRWVAMRLEREYRSPIRTLSRRGA